ncbi:MAG: hypothetical protein OXU92_02290 [Deltaproteobacteria bacterium]|nr:hypothetical protein [Deltaproteobacteria bacterium]
MTARTLRDKAHAGFAKDIYGLRDEEDIRARIKQWLVSVVGGEDHVRLKNAVPGGFTDILIESHKIVIETKARDRAGPEKPGSKKGETQLEQLSRYLKHMKGREGPFPNGTPWLGVLTDGMNWWLYQWNAERNAAEPLGDPLSLDRNSETRRGQIAELYQHYFSATRRKAGKPPPPDDIASRIAEPFMDRLRPIYAEVEEQRHLPTKLGVWKDILKGSGILPPKLHGFKTILLFLQHCVLVSTTRAIVAEIAKLQPEPEQALAGGFTAWIAETRHGHIWAKKLFREVRRFDWRSGHSDNLKQVYEGLIPQEDRHGFGEYYTPGWLAEFLCGQILDEDWLDRAVRGAMATLTDPKALRPPGLGVLDPACGSGVFLFHAARRIVAHAAKQHRLSEKQCATIAARLVHGMDIHPVAVEMATATLLSALPAVPEGGAAALSVYQGDSMLLRYRENELKGLGEGGLAMSSPKGNPFHIPQAALASENFRAIIEDAVGFATRSTHGGQEKKPAFSRKSWARPFAAAERGEIETLAVNLREIYKKEGNSIWEWYIHNLAQPLRLHREKVDRMIGNPPWVSTAAARSEGEHQQAVEKMAKDYGLRMGGLGGSASESNFAAPFLLRCRDLYLAKQDAMCAFVLPFSALRSSGWQAFADPGKFRLWTETHDLSKMRDGPFKGSATASLWIDRGGRRRKRAAKIWKNRSREKVSLLDFWSDVEQKIVIRASATRPEGASCYKDSFRKGANLNPTRFVVVEIVEEYGDGSVQVKGRVGSQDKQPWTGYEPTDKRVERAALLPAVLPDNLQNFRITAPAYYVLGPFRRSNSRLYEISAVDSLTDEWGAVGSRFQEVWKPLDEDYRKLRSRSLAELLDYSGNLTMQLPLNEARSGRRVIYNKSGQHLLATRLISPRRGDFIANDALYYWTASSQNEALFLVGVLNAETLQQAYREARQTDRHYDKHIWRKLPIPKFDKNNPLHAEVVKAARACEKKSQSLPPHLNRKQLRTTLNQSPQMQTLNQAIQAIPDLKPYCNWREP